MKKILITLLAVTSLLLIIACSNIDQEYAELVAKKFVRENVKFFSKTEIGDVDLNAYEITSVDSYIDGKKWIVSMHVEAKQGNETKKNDMIVIIDRRGDVLELNGEKVKN